MRLSGKVAIITGGASGLGAAQAQLFHQEGASVVITDISSAGESVAKGLGERALFLRHDVASEDGWGGVTKAAQDSFGGIDILSNTAGITIFGRIDETSTEDFETQYSVNQRGAFFGMRAVVEPMTRAGGGAIVNISSAAALIAMPEMLGYSASKWALRGMSRVAAADLADRHIRVNTIFPGAIDTPMMAANSAERNAAMLARVPMGRLGTPMEVAHAALFLVSDEASYVSGAELAVTGGAVT